jgi:hypothetical protein
MISVFQGGNKQTKKTKQNKTKIPQLRTAVKYLHLIKEIAQIIDT